MVYIQNQHWQNFILQICNFNALKPFIIAEIAEAGNHGNGNDMFYFSSSSCRHIIGHYMTWFYNASVTIDLHLKFFVTQNFVIFKCCCYCNVFVCWHIWVNIKLIHRIWITLFFIIFTLWLSIYRYTHCDFYNGYSSSGWLTLAIFYRYKDWRIINRLKLYGS